MPFFYLSCRPCGRTERRMLEPTHADRQNCSVCGGRLIRAPKVPSTQVNESIDNGLMPRAVERLADAPRLFHERARQHSRHANESE